MAGFDQGSGTAAAAAAAAVSCNEDPLPAFNTTVCAFYCSFCLFCYICRITNLVELKEFWKPSRRMNSRWTPLARTYIQVRVQWGFAVGFLSFHSCCIYLLSIIPNSPAAAAAAGQLAVVLAVKVVVFLRKVVVFLLNRCVLRPF
jgi:hypothetical protein